MNRRRRSYRRRSYRRNVYMPLYTNRRRHRRSHRRAHHRYRRNPAFSRGMTLAGIKLPPLDAVLWVGAGMITPPIVSSYIIGWIPDSFKTIDATGAKVMPMWLTWVVKAASVILPSWLVRRFVNTRAGNLMLVGGFATFALDLVRTFAPGMIPGLGYQPLLGAYTSYPSPQGQIVRFRQNPRMLPPQVAEAPERLSPASRF